MINEFPAPNLPPNNTLWFKQDGATVHTAVFKQDGVVLRNNFSLVTCQPDNGCL
jgi:hypothetical protein